MAWPGTLTAEEQEVVKVFTDQMYRPDVVEFVRSYRPPDCARLPSYRDLPTAFWRFFDGGGRAR